MHEPKSPSSLLEGIYVNQGQAAALFDVCAKTLRNWESFNPDLRGDRPNKTTVEYSLEQLARFSRRVRKPLSVKGAKATGLPLHLFSGFFVRGGSPRKLERTAGSSDALLRTLQLTEQLRKLAEEDVEALTPRMLAGLRYGLRSAPAEVTAIAALLESLASRAEGGG